MRISKWTALVFLGGAISAWGWHHMDMGLHPGYKVHAMHPAAFNPQVCGMDFLPDGKMVLLTWKGWNNESRTGKLYLVEGMEGTSGEMTKPKLIADSLDEAMGVVVVRGEIYVGNKSRIVKLTGKNDTGYYAGKQVIGTLPFGNQWFEYAFGPVFRNERLYMGLAVGVKGSGDTLAQKVDGRGTVISYPIGGGPHEIVASGFRAPDGIGLGPEDELFITDNQGGWLPTSKIIHVVPGRFYGYQTIPPGRFQDKPMTQPSLWLPYRDCNNSPTEPALMKAGIFKGQLFFGDISKGGVHRAFLEKVRDPKTGLDEYQGAAFHFSGALEAGAHRIRLLPGGEILVGGLGTGMDAYNLGWQNTKAGLQKFVPIPGARVFEMLAVRSRRNGMEVEFTQPVDTSAENKANYAVQTWNYIPEAKYGGGQQPKQTLAVGRAQVSGDRRSVFLEIAGLKDDGFVVHIKAAKALRSQAKDTLLFPDAWYTLRAISPSAAFTPTGTASGSPGLWDLDLLRPTLSLQGELSLALPAGLKYTVEIADMRGRVKAVRRDVSGFQVFRRSLFGSGLHFLRVSQGRREVVKRIAL